VGADQIPKSEYAIAANLKSADARKRERPWEVVTLYLRGGALFSQARMPAHMVGDKLIRHRGMVFKWDAHISGYVEVSLFDAPIHRE
jgi:hypothetical protein